MQHHLRLGLLYPIVQGREVSKIGGAMVPSAASEAIKRELAEEVGISLRLQRVAPHLRAQLLQPQQQPAALEASMSGQKNFSTTPEIGSQREFPRHSVCVWLDAL